MGHAAWLSPNQVFCLVPVKTLHLLYFGSFEFPNPELSELHQNRHTSLLTLALTNH